MVRIFPLHYASLEEFWAYWSRYIYVNRYDQPAGKPYEDLLSLVKEKDCFVLTTNVDHRFQTAGFDKERLFYTQGDYGLFPSASIWNLPTRPRRSRIAPSALRRTSAARSNSFWRSEFI